MDRIFELVENVPEVSVETIYWMIDHACRVDKLSLKVCRERWEVMDDKILTWAGRFNNTRRPRDISVHRTIVLSISKRANTEPRRLSHTLRYDLPGGRDGTCAFLY